MLAWKKETRSEKKVFPEFISRCYFVGYNEGGTHKRKGKKKEFVQYFLRMSCEEVT